jgi:hypothetical protein
VPASPSKTADFEQLEIRRYGRVLEYSAAEYVRLLRTHSNNILLAPDVRERLLGGVGEVIERHGGTLRLPVPTVLCLARAG